jgi:hypothetical protein
VSTYGISRSSPWMPQMNDPHLPPVEYISECVSGHEFQWGYKNGAMVSHVTERNCDCDINWFKCLKERVEVE